MHLTRYKPGNTMIRVLAYGTCLAGFLWLALASVRFRQAIRDSLGDAYSQMAQVVPDRAGDAGKVLNSYYEDVYFNLPSVFWPAGIWMIGSTLLFIARQRHNPESATGSNGGLATPLDNSEVTKRPASVS
jgi:hypothetical protein